jgi:hypothetical protein
VLGGRQLLIGDSAPFPADLPSLVHPHADRPTPWAPLNTSHPLMCEEMWSRCQEDAMRWYRARSSFCERSVSQREADDCRQRLYNSFDSAIEACREAYDCISGCSQSPIAPYGVRCCYGGKQACGTGVFPDCVDLKTDAKNCGTCGRACGQTEYCANGSCACTREYPYRCRPTDPECCENSLCCGGACCPKGSTKCRNVNGGTVCA